tara:strand:+ start:297 stop:2423 length:2127 start_codon:yes stop_codon:yes gene_type:complete
MNSKKKNNLKIATILPYKENYAFEKASAASLWVSEFYKNSKYKNNNFIYGNTNYKNYLTKNYRNISLKSISSKFKSSTNEYCDKLINEFKIKKYDLIEIHNRPLILKRIAIIIKNKFIFYFHNDPLSMKGSISVNERLWILKNVEKIIFVSEYVRNRFFIDLDDKLRAKTEVIYPSVNKTKIKKKEKYITFVGKLNSSKGYDIFEKSIVKILDEFPDWKAFSIGDEERRTIYINHRNHTELGFINHRKVLNQLNISEIAVTPSMWDEPFGRTALEATSRGCATVISQKGGLPETSDYTHKLKKNDSNELYKSIKKIILDKSYRKTLQSKSFKNIKHLIKDNTKIIDSIRLECLPIKNFNIIKKRLKILNIYNQGQKLDHRLFNISIGKKFSNGFIRNGHDVLEISDRDFIKNNRSFSLNSSKQTFQKHLVETFKNYNPDILFFGHTKNLENNTFEEFKNINKNLIISQWNEDPIMNGLDYSKKNIINIKRYLKYCDHTFISTNESILKTIDKKRNNIHFFFIPVDKNIECFEVFKLRPQKDLFYAMSHGVNRAVLKEGIEDDRIIFLDKLVKKISDIKYDFYGFSNKQPIWGNDFFKSLTNSKMALNLSRGKPTKHYSSNRIASVMGNGLLTFVDEKVKMDDFFKKDELIFYNNINDLADKIRFYAKNDKLRKKIASNGKKKYFKLFNEQRISKYILDLSLGNNAKLF